MASKIKVELNPRYNVNGIPRQFEVLSYLRHVDEICVVENEDFPALCIFVNGFGLGLVDPYDDYEATALNQTGFLFPYIMAFRPSVIFKYQWRRGVRYPPGTISAGYPCFRQAQASCPADLLTRSRPVDVTARMRVNGDYHWAVNQLWMLARSQIIEQAKLLEREGWNSKWGFVPTNEYVAELWDAQLGFDWRGAGFLTHRIIEYIRAGVVPITCPLGEEWPVREDVVLEDGIHCVFCSDPQHFASEARLLLADQPKIKKIRRNLIELWQEKLSPAAQGYWLWKQLKAALIARQDEINRFTGSSGLGDHS